MTYQQWFKQVCGLDHKSPEAQALIQQYPRYYQQLRDTVRAALQQAKETAQ